MHIFAHILLLTPILVFAGNSTLLHRQKRYLYFPNGGTFKLVLGFAIPIKLGLKQSAAWGWNIQFQYAEPQNTNSTPPWPPIIARSAPRSKREAPGDRSLFYTALEDILNRNGMNGRSCLLRSICENAMASLFHSSNGLYGQLLHIALTPDYKATDPNLDPIYTDAKKAGEYGVECATLYPECAQGPLDAISFLDNMY